jgi:hypothetical protein
MKLPHQSNVPPVEDQDAATKGKGGAAEALQTTGASVGVAAAAPPSIGQVLTALSGTTADWQTPSLGLPSNDKALAVVRASNQGAGITDAAQTGLDITGDITLQAWVFWDSLGLNQYFLGKNGTGGVPTSYEMRITTANSMAFMWYNGISTVQVTQAPDTPFETGRWYHLTMSRQQSSGNVKFYVNGLQNGSTQVSGPGDAITDSGKPFHVGSNQASFALDGKIDEARVWNIERTPADILADYLLVLAGTEAGLQGYWRLDGDYTDETANGNTLTPVNSPTFSEDVPFVSGLHVEQHHKGGADELILQNASSGALAADQLLNSDGAGGWTNRAFPVGGTGVAQNRQFASFVRASSMNGSISDATQVANGNALGITEDITLEARIRFSSLGLNQYPVAKFDAGSIPQGYAMRITTANVMAFGYNIDGGSVQNITQAPLSAIVIDRWYDWAMSRDKATGTVKFYIDGVFQGSSVSGPGFGIAVNAKPFNIGGYGSFHLDGDIARVRVWSVVRTEAEIAGSRFHDMSGDEFGLAGEWRLDGDWADSTPSGNTLTPQNSPTFTEGGSDQPVTHEVIVLESDSVGKPSVQAGTVDPSSSGVAAHEGSLFLQYVADGGKPYVKVGSADTDWVPVGGGVGVFGDASDGDSTLGSDLTLTEDAYYDTLDTNGWDVNCDGFRLFCRTELIVRNGSSVNNDGAAGSGISAGAAAPAGTVGGGGIGGASGVGAGSAGTGVSNAAHTANTSGGTGGTDGGGGGGGAGGVSTALTETQHKPRSLPEAVTMMTLGGGSLAMMTGGGGGGGGEGDGSTDAGGGGGGGGGIVMVAAPKITIESSGEIAARGGAGADASDFAGTGAGGGGGGAGGAVSLVYLQLANTGAIVVSGGLGGSGVNGGGSGIGGGAGTVWSLQLRP